MVPVHLDALHLEIDRLVVEAMADFSRLPYFDFDGQRDVNPNIANISEEIVSQPFQNQNLYLKAGIHLHWALPDALTKGIQVNDHNETQTVFPPVPNRWLVTRSNKDNEIEKQWVVESDYLYPEGQGSQTGSIAYPIQVQEGKHQPFRYLGRKVSLADWRENDPNAEYLPSLTAVGYGEPTFSAFYPNCHSVFGFYDDDYADQIPDGLKYDVIGWYTQPQQDRLNAFLEILRRSIPQDQGTSPTNQELIEEEFKWKVNLETGQNFPASLEFICYARLTFASQNTVNSDRQASVEVSVGNTGTEALSAYLGQKIDGNNKSIIEDQLEALHLSPGLEHRQLDITPKFKEARHEKGFNAIAAGTMWTIRLESEGSTTANAEDAHNQAQITLRDEMAHLLNELNLRQQEYDFAWHEIESMRRQLFADWYKYMLSTYPPEGSRDEYPDIDEVKHYIKIKGIPPLKAKLTTTGNLMLSENDSGQITTASAGASSSASIAAQLAGAINQLLAEITKLNNQETVKKTQATYTLKQISSPRYWQPKEPALLMTGEGVKPTIRHGQDGRLRDDGLLECEILKDVTIPIAKQSFSGIRNKIVQLEQNKMGEHIAFSSWTQSPWHPFLLEWEVEVFPTREGCNHRSYNSNYDNEFITDNYVLRENEPDLSLQSGKGAIIKAANVYSGRSILTPYAGIKLKAELEVYLEKQVLPDYYKAKKIPKEQQSDDYLSDNIQAILTWYETKPETEKEAKKPIYTAIRAYQKLLTLNSLSQSLGGFNEALLMHKQTLQLPVADPLGFADYQPFTEVVRDAIVQSNRSAPEPLNDFNPIRSGAMKILRLRLVDTFGQVKDLDVSNIITTEQMTTPGSSYLVSLPPRLVQPARLNFRWLSASQGEQEMNSHPATTPICGWILPNNLDNSLAIYDNLGKALGSINQLAEWESALGSDRLISVDDIDDIPNLYLKRVVKHIVHPPQPPLEREESVSFLSNLISALDSGLENIDPENFAQHQGLALLMGRPIAVVRASLNLELQGLPSINQDWNVFWQDLRRDSRDTDGFDQVKFPIRLGEYQQLNDGLLGYWLEKEDALSQEFYAPQSDLGQGTSKIKIHHPENAWHIDFNVEDAPKLFTMLIDPRGKVHATCGILPTKAIDIPPDQYQEALEKIEITFLSTPILTDLKDLRDSTLDKKINLPLPGEPGYEWSWLEKEQGEWLEVPHDNIAQPNPNAVFSGQQAIREGWLKLSPANTNQNSNN
ncbi:MAG: hypothetical protein F6K40_19175 [Okeania sp. SIO3I5]|nr:hypothetical protein [Okeania sp. SIO3I5]